MKADIIKGSLIGHNIQISYCVGFRHTPPEYLLIVVLMGTFIREYYTIPLDLSGLFDNQDGSALLRKELLQELLSVNHALPKKKTT